MKTLLILNDSPYGSERTYNALRLAGDLARRANSKGVVVFLTGDAVLCAKAGQVTPPGFYNIAVMLRPVLRTGEVLLCGVSMDARGMRDAELIEGARRSTLSALSELTLSADKVLVF